MIDKEIESVRANGSGDECYRLSYEILHRSEALYWRIWPYGHDGKWGLRVARREHVQGFTLQSKAHGDYLARHKWAKYKRQFLNYKSMLALVVMSEEFFQLGRLRSEDSK